MREGGSERGRRGVDEEEEVGRVGNNDNTVYVFVH